MDSGFKILHKIIQAANIRQKVISSNIANADTPGYKAKDVKFGNLLGREMKMKTSDPKHVGSMNRDSISAKIVTESNLAWGDQNNVEINIEVAKMTENSLLHNTAITILGSKIKMFKAAIKVGRSEEHTSELQSH